MEIDGNTIEWRKARKSSTGNCVEVARLDGGVAVRNSRHPDAEIILYTRDEFDAFIDGIKRGEFDDIVQ